MKNYLQDVTTLSDVPSWFLLTQCIISSQHLTTCWQRLWICISDRECRLHVSDQPMPLRHHPHSWQVAETETERTVTSKNIHRLRAVASVAPDQLSIVVGGRRFSTSSAVHAKKITMSLNKSRTPSRDRFAPGTSQVLNVFRISLFLFRR